VLYTEGLVFTGTSAGNPHHRGAVFVKGTVEFLGKALLNHHDDCIQNLGLHSSLTCG
jgi:hypothetical protein